MPDKGSRGELFSEQTALVLVVFVTSAVAFTVVRPYLQYVLFAGVFAYVLYPVQKRLEEHVEPMTAAISLTVVAVLTVLLPLAYVGVLTIRQGTALLRAFERGTINIGAVERQLAEIGIDVDIQVLYDTYRGPITGAVETVAFGTLDVVRGLPNLFVGLTILVFVLFALLRDGPAVVAWTRDVTPIRAGLHAEFLQKVDKLMWASIVGNVAVALIQALMLGAALLLLGTSNVIFYTFATFVLSLLPLVGAFIVWLPISLYLFALGRTTSAVFLFVYGSIVSVSDFYLRPAVIGKSGALNSAVVVVFGFVGLFLGPVVLGAAKLALDVYAAERTERAPV